ncbi:MAG: hypothetical protein J0I12_03955 [Candidatus Eremiobacteraeota bacterium]|nr:hypothetical protein [Candidatus Eremiobacteraeota bacterium]
MTGSLGQFGLTLHESDLNTLLAPQGMAFRGGCFHLRTKLAMGLGVSLVAVPRSSPEGLVFSIPFDQIRGDKTGGVAAMLAGGLWGVIRPVIEKRIKKELQVRGIPEEAVSLGQAVEDKVKVGLVTLRLRPLNEWLAVQEVAGLRLHLDALWATETGVQLVLGVF